MKVKMSQLLPTQEQQNYRHYHFMQLQIQMNVTTTGKITLDLHLYGLQKDSGLLVFLTSVSCTQSKT